MTGSWMPLPPGAWRAPRWRKSRSAISCRQPTAPCGGRWKAWPLSGIGVGGWKPAPPGLPVPSRTIVKGDALSASVAAASILAKVSRDRLMAELDRRYPEYAFAKHKGYGTALHIERIRA